MGKRCSLDVQIGWNLRKLRMREGLTLEEMGRRLGVTYQQVQKYESGGNRLAAARLALACGVLHCEVSDILTAEIVSEALDDRRTALGITVGERRAG